MNIIIKEYNQFNEEEILHLYNAVGWFNYTSNTTMLKNSYQHSLSVFAAYKDKKLVGIIRVVGDGYSLIYIQDLIVLPAYQRHGIGSLLVNTILDKYSNVYQKILLTDNHETTVNFYTKLGFTNSNLCNCICFMK